MAQREKAASIVGAALIMASLILLLPVCPPARASEANAAQPGAAPTVTPKKSSATSAHAAAKSRSAASRGQVGLASYYGAKHRGKRTASGERFDDRSLTAAHRSLPLNSKAKVTDLKTGHSVDVTITDRGPYRKNRVIDLSSAAAKQIGIDRKDGVDPVRIEPLGAGKPDVASAARR